MEFCLEIKIITYQLQIEENELVKTLIEDVELINFGKNKVEIDLNNKILNIKIVNPDGRILLIGPGSLSGWSVNLESDLEPSQSEIRMTKFVTDV